MSRIQGGDHSRLGAAAFEDLYARHFDSVYGYLRAMLGGADEAEDAVQEVFERAFHSGPTHPPKARPWLFSIARAAVLARGCSRHGRRDGGGVSDPELMQLIHELPELERDAVVLRHLVGLSPAETAQALGRNRLTAARAHRRGLRALENRAGRGDRADAPLPVLAGA